MDGPLTQPECFEKLGVWPGHGLAVVRAPARALRVLAVGRRDGDVAPGGGEIQIASTVKALGRLGVGARPWRPDGGELPAADCIHLFGSRPENLLVALEARRRGIPVVLSTIAWFDWRDYWRGGASVAASVAAVARFAARAVFPRLPSWRRRLYQAADLLLPNSKAEAEQLVRYFGVETERIRVVPNGADLCFAQTDPRSFVERFGTSGFVLCPGRIEPRKNQLGLIRAMRGCAVGLVILGEVVPGHEAYLDACRRAAGENVRFLDRLEHDDPMLGAAYAACGCVAMPSWFETPGLAALEAGMTGAPLVLSAGGCCREYFGSYAQYVHPGDYREIRHAVDRALELGRSKKLAEHVRENFSWDRAAGETLAAYEEAVGRGSSASVLPRRAIRTPREGGRYRYVRRRWHVLFSAVDAAGAWFFSLGRLVRRRAVASGDPRAILVVQLDHLGDAILSTGMIAMLRRRYPRARIEVLAGCWNRDLFEAMDEVDCVHVSRVNRFSRAGRFGWPLAVFRWGWQLHGRGIDLAIDARGEFPLALLGWLCGARRRLGWAAGGGGFLLTDSPEYVPNRPETESRRALLAELGIEAAPDEFRPRFHPTEAARRRIERRLARRGPRGPFVAIHVSAGTTVKEWPPEHWRELTGRVIVDHGLEIVLVGSRGDRAIAETILAGQEWPGVHDWTGRCDVVELAALFERAEVVVGADSGPVHLASAVGCPVVVVASGTNRIEQWRPPGANVHVVRHAVACSPCHRTRCRVHGHPCMRDLAPERVAEAVSRSLESIENGSRKQ